MARVDDVNVDTQFNKWLEKQEVPTITAETSEAELRRAVRVVENEDGLALPVALQGLTPKGA